jgi:hypothetical protein
MSLQSKTPRNYLNNKDMLAEIHKSKNSYCFYTKPEYADYDIILDSIDDIQSSLLPTKGIDVDKNGVKKEVVIPPAAQAARAKRLTVAAQDAALLTGKKLKAEEVGITHNDIKVTDLVFRITSWSHIPEAPAVVKVNKGKKSKSVELDEEVSDIIVTEYDEEEPIVDSPVALKYVKLNFPPFLHYRILTDGSLEVVGKSHWKGDLETGTFCRDHGKPTNKLAMMWMKICDRYATRSNWRGYSYNDEMRSQGILQLTVVGLQFNEAKSQNPFAYYTAAVTNSFTRVLNTEKKSQNIRDDLLQDAGLDPSFSRQNQTSDD